MMIQTTLNKTLTIRALYLKELFTDIVSPGQIESTMLIFAITHQQIVAIDS
jgi:hypothetical protein